MFEHRCQNFETILGIAYLNTPQLLIITFIFRTEFFLCWMKQKQFIILQIFILMFIHQYPGTNSTPSSEIIIRSCWAKLLHGKLQTKCGYWPANKSEEDLDIDKKLIACLLIVRKEWTRRKWTLTLRYLSKQTYPTHVECVGFWYPKPQGMLCQKRQNPLFQLLLV